MTRPVKVERGGIEPQSQINSLLRTTLVCMLQRWGTLDVSFGP